MHFVINSTGLSLSIATVEIKEDVQTQNDQRLVFVGAVAQSFPAIHKDPSEMLSYLLPSIKLGRNKTQHRSRLD